MCFIHERFPSLQSISGVQSWQFSLIGYDIKFKYKNISIWMKTVKAVSRLSKSSIVLNSGYRHRGCGPDKICLTYRLWSFFPCGLNMSRCLDDVSSIPFCSLFLSTGCRQSLIINQDFKLHTAWSIHWINV